MDAGVEDQKEAVVLRAFHLHDPGEEGSRGGGEGSARFKPPLRPRRAAVAGAQGPESLAQRSQVETGAGMGVRPGKSAAQIQDREGKSDRLREGLGDRVKRKGQVKARLGTGQSPLESARDRSKPSSRAAVISPGEVRSAWQPFRRSSEATDGSGLALKE